MFPPEGSGLGIWGHYTCCTSESLPEARAVILTVLCWRQDYLFLVQVRNQTIKYLRDLATAVQGVFAKAVSSHSEHWCWPTSLRAQLISCSAHLSWPVFVALVRHKVQMEGCPLVLVGSWAVCCKPGAFSNRIWAAALCDEARAIPGTAGKSKLNSSQFLPPHGKAGGRMEKKLLSDYSSCMCFGRENTV